MERPFEIVFAGPAGGTIASAHFGGLINTGNLLCADIGGTSCDISLISDFKPYVNTTFELEHDLIRRTGKANRLCPFEIGLVGVFVEPLVGIEMVGVEAAVRDVAL